MYIVDMTSGVEARNIPLARTSSTEIEFVLRAQNMIQVN